MISHKKEKIRIKLESFDPELLNIACQQIIAQVKLNQTKIIGPIPLPKKKKYIAFYDHLMLIKIRVNILKYVNIPKFLIFTQYQILQQHLYYLLIYLLV